MFKTENSKKSPEFNYTSAVGFVVFCLYTSFIIQLISARITVCLLLEHVA